MQLPKVVAGRLADKKAFEHPDADLLTAFVECTLLGEEREQILRHLAECAECRQVTALAAPELPFGAIRRIAGRKRWPLAVPLLRWGALAACLVVLMLALLIHRAAPPSPRQRGVVARLESPSREAVPRASAPEEAKQIAPSGPGAFAAKAKTRQTPGRAPKRAAEEATTNRVHNPGTETDGNSLADALPPQASSESVEMQAPTVTVDQAPSARAEKELRARSSTTMADAAPAFVARPTRDTAASTIGGAAKLTDFRAPNWRLSEKGLPERSFNPGQWEQVQVDHMNGFRSLAAVGMDVWVGGAAGLLYHSQDVGLNWTRVIPATADATLADDITAIVFADHLHGNLTTARGQVWITSDAGKSWETK